MTFYANQKVILVIKSAADKNNPYALYNKAATIKAMQTLTPNAFKLWCYIGLNKNGYEFALSSIDVQPKCNMSRSSYYSTVKELENKGYLQKRKEDRGFFFSEDGTPIEQ